MSALEQARDALRARQGAGARYDAPTAPAADLALARRGAAYFARRLNAQGDADLALPSSRPGWSRQRVTAAVALQARAFAQAIATAQGGENDEHAETDRAALDLAETLPPRALRHLAAHAAIHLDVAWRDMSDADWEAELPLQPSTPARATPLLQALALWRGALALGGRLRDVPEELRDTVAQQD